MLQYIKACSTYLILTVLIGYSKFKEILTFDISNMNISKAFNGVINYILPEMRARSIKCNDL